MEERMRAFMRSAGEGAPPTHQDWDAFVRRAHRHRLVHRAVVVGTAAVVAVALVASAAFLRDVVSRPDAIAPIDNPPDGPIELVPRRVAQDCPAAPAFEPGSNAGAVAYLQGRGLHVLDLGSGEERTLLTLRPGLDAGRVRISPDGRWVSFGPGYVVPTAGGRVCAPLGGDLLGGTEWTAEGDMVGGARGRLLLGGPGSKPQPVYEPPEGLAVGDFALDASGRRVAFDVHDATGAPGSESVWRAGLYEEPATHLVFELPPDDPSTLRVAGVAPGEEAIFAFKSAGRSASLSAEGETLLALSLVGRTHEDEIATMLAYPDFLTSCGDRTIVTSGGDRFVTDGKNLVSVAAPGFDPEPLATGPDGSLFWTSCAPDGRIAATTSPSQPESRFGTLPRYVSIVRAEGMLSLAEAVPDGFAHEYPRFSNDGGILLVVERRLRPEGPASLVLLDPETGERTPIGASLGPVSSVYGHYEYANLFDWYQP